MDPLLAFLLLLAVVALAAALAKQQAAKAGIPLKLATFALGVVI
jgi:hypothetical protein